MPDELTVREATPDDIPGISRVHVASWLSTYRGIVPDSFLDNLTIEKHIQRHRRVMSEAGKLYFVAESRVDGIVGFLSGGPNRSDDSPYPGELHALYILADHQRKGIGARLVNAWAANLLQNGMRSAVVWAFEANHAAIAFYKSLGAQFHREHTLEIAGQHIPEHAFAWDDLSIISKANHLG